MPHDTPTPDPAQSQLPSIDRPIDRGAFSICDLHDQPNDLAYWLSVSPEDRIAAIEYMRQVIYGTDPAHDRVQRVLEIIDRPPR
jgi:hypothetical protein